tara:strand:+ start:158 stop:1477 length:1320 start_codon:yes stop_codon:yes gene_type:complete
MPNTFNYTPGARANPEGNNGLSARAKFFQRSLYKEVIYPDNVPKPLESWYDKNLFGRVDRNQNPIVCHPSRLVSITRARSPNVRALEFVNLAFDDFAKHMTQAFLSNCISRNGNPALFNLQAVMGYTDPYAKYNAHMQGLIQAFIKVYKDSSEHPIRNFKDFKREYLQYLRVMAEGVPITFSSFLLSAMTSPFVSGLKVAIAKADAGDDAAKYEQFIRDPNFSFYVGSAKNYGFLVDKNAPWILTADLFSLAFGRYPQYFTTDAGRLMNTQVQFFSTYFFPTSPTDISSLNTHLRSAYAAYYNIYPIYEEEKTVYNPRCTTAWGGSPLKTEVGYRALPADSDLLTPKELIDLYSFLRRKEVGDSGPSLQSVRKRAYELYRSGLLVGQGVATFIANSYQNFIYPSSYFQINPNFDVDKVIQADILDTVAEVASQLDMGSY